MLFVSKVISSDPATFVVLISGQADNDFSVISAVPLVSVFTGLLGFKESFLPSPGSSVLCYRLSKTHAAIVGVLPTPDMVTGEWASVSLPFTGNPAILDTNYSDEYAGEKADYFKNQTFNNNRPTDVVAGEYTLSNDFGVLLGLFQQLAVLKGSELSQVQCHLFDDLVKIISHNFHQVSCLSDTKIFHDGKTLNLEFLATHKPNEMLGSPVLDAESNSPLFVEGNPAADPTQHACLHKDGEAVVPIDRLKLYLGALGDFFNLFLVRPSGDVRFDDGTGVKTYDAGLAQFHVGLNGAAHLRSAKEIFIEKTNFIKVPTRIRRPEDPEGNGENTLLTNPANFKFDASNPNYSFLQLRDYTAYVLETLNYRRFSDYFKDFNLPETKTTQQPLVDEVVLDPETKSTYTNKTSGLYFMEDGSVVISDGSGSSIVMSGGNIYLQAAKDVVQQPLRNAITKAGGLISIHANKNMELVSTTGAIIAKSEKEQFFFSKSSGIAIEANGESSTYPDPKTKEYSELGGGVFIKSKAGIYNHGKHFLANTTDGKVTLNSEEGDVVLHGRTVSALGENQLNLFSKETIQTYAGSSMLFFSSSNVSIGSGNGEVAVVGGTGTRIGHAKGNLNLETVKELGGDTQKHNHQVKPSGSPIDGTAIVNLSTNIFDTFSTGVPVFDAVVEDDFKTASFRFFKSEDYAFGEDEFIPQTLAQQIGDLSNSAADQEEGDNGGSNTNTTKWDFSLDAIESTYPFPGAIDNKFLKYKFNNTEADKTGVLSNKIKPTEIEGKLVKASLSDYEIY